MQQRLCLVLNEIWQLNFTSDELIKIGATDRCGCTYILSLVRRLLPWVLGKELSTIELSNEKYLVWTLTLNVNTAELFSHPKLQRDIAPISISIIQNQYADYVQTLTAPYHNVFTLVVTSLAPTVTEALSYLQGLEAKAMGTARMTRSGS